MTKKASILSPEDYSGTFRITGGLNGGTSAIEVNVAFLVNAIVTAVDMYQLVNLVFALSNAVALAGPLVPIVAIGAYVLICQTGINVLFLGVSYLVHQFLINRTKYLSISSIAQIQKSSA